MSGVYGTVKPASIDIKNDIVIYYNFKPNRSSTYESKFKELDLSCLTESNGDGSVIEGLYDLKLPLNIFGDKGIYTIYIAPKPIRINIEDISTLDKYPDVRGIVFNNKTLPDFLKSPNALVGYRIEYDGESNSTKIITSSNPCTMVSGVSKYRLESSSEVSNQIFCTVTPSTAPSFSPNNSPSIGVKSEEVTIYNTKFNPLLVEVEMVDKDIETLSYMLEGDQVRNLDTGVFTVYNDEGDIYTQFETYNLKTRLGKPLYDVKVNKGIVDSSETYQNTIKSNE